MIVNSRRGNIGTIFFLCGFVIEFGSTHYTMANYIEIPMLISAFAAMLTAPVYTNFIIYRTCYVSLGYNETECAMLGNVNNNITEKLEPLVEPEVTVINTVKSVVESVITIILCLFIGPWSDKFGRKPVMVANFLGGTISSILIFLSSCFRNVSPWYIIMCSLPATLTGAGPASLTILLSYITDTTAEEKRGLRLAVLDLIFNLAYILGSLSSSYVFTAINYPGVFGISFVLGILSGLYVIFFLSESVENVEREGKIREFFSIAQAKEMAYVSFKKRDNFKREIILLMFLFMITSTLSSGEQGLTFLYLRERFGWTLKKFTLFGSWGGLVAMIGVGMGVYILHVLLRVTESVLALMGLISSLNGVLLMGLATRDYHIYFASVVRCLGGITTPMIRSLMSKLVPNDEIGKLFSLTMVFTFIVGMASTPMYNLIYKDTLQTNPAFYNFVTAGFHVASILVVAAISVFEFINFRRYQVLENEPLNEELERHM